MSKVLCVAVAARRGAEQFQKHTWMELASETTLRAVGRSICPDGELLHVEARKDIDGEVSEFSGGMLDRNLAFVVGQAHLQYLKCCFAMDRVDVELKRLHAADGKRANQGRFQAMMEDKRRHTSYHWPALYNDSTTNKTVIRDIANNIIIAGRSDQQQYGGFSSSLVASTSRSHIWSLAEVLYALVPHATALENRSMSIPLVLLDAVEAPWIKSTAVPAAEPENVEEQASYHERLGSYVCKLRSIAGQDGFVADSMRMSNVVCELADNVARYREYLINLAATRHQKGRDHSVQCGAPAENGLAPQRDYDKAYHSILLDERPATLTTSDHASTMQRINDMLSKAGPYQPVRIDKLLLGESEALDVKRRTQSINSRLKFVLNRARLDHNVQVYRYHIGQHFGTHNYLWMLSASDDREQWESKSLRTLTKLKADLPVFLSRKYHESFANKYSSISQMTASLRRDLLRVVAGDCSLGSHGEQDKAGDARLELWLEADAELADEIIVDMRKLNKSESHYDRFWEIMAKFLEEHDMKVNVAISQLPLLSPSSLWYHPAPCGISQLPLLSPRSLCYHPAASAISQLHLLSPSSLCYHPAPSAITQLLVLSPSSLCYHPAPSAITQLPVLSPSSLTRHLTRSCSCCLHLRFGER
jgi:hypothetical protein